MPYRCMSARIGHLTRCLIAVVAVFLFALPTALADPVEDSCATAAPDDWPTWSHDYQHTGASNIAVGDPNGITLAWSTQLGSLMNFCNPTVADDYVYASSDDRLEGFDLATGTPIVGSPLVTSFPSFEMGLSNRGNTTIHNGVVYMTGGNYCALSALPLGDLRRTSIIWSNNPLTQASMSRPNRFGAALAIDDLDGMGTDVVFVLTEPTAGQLGELFAFDASNGNLYDGWLVNPLVFDYAALHGPAYDGTHLYVTTANGNTSRSPGSIYCIDPVAGTILWSFQDNTIDPANPGGFPGGVSIEGDYLYAASADRIGNGRRFKIDKSGSTPLVVWAEPQSRVMYAAPTIGRDYLYIPQDNAPGVLVVDKATGAVVHNFAADGVGRVSQNIALSCDSYLFVGDRNARWWVLDANTFETEFYRQYPVPESGIVNGTALATDTAGNHYAVVGIRTDGTSGRVSVYRLDTGSRPRLQQNVFSRLIEVPLESGSGLTYSIADVFASIGNEDVAFESVTIGDPDPDPLLKLEPSALQRLDNDPYSKVPVSADQWTHFSGDRVTKGMRLAGVGGPMTEGGEFTQYEYDRFIQPLEAAQAASSRAQVRLAATATSLTRTSNVTIGGSAVPTTLSPGTTADLAWECDGTDLGRGTDVEVIQLVVNDPDFDYATSSAVAEFEITYIGGCPLSRTTLPWYAGSEAVYNDGGLGDGYNNDELIWNDDPNDPNGPFIYDGGLFIAADYPTLSLAIYDINGFVSNRAPVSGVCGFDEYTDVAMGAYRTGGIPGTPVPVTGNIVVASYSDTGFSSCYSLEPAIGVDVIQTEVGANDPLYGDFKLIRWELHERNGNALTNIHAGTMIDWDLPDVTWLNRAALWPNTVNGYAIWGETAPGNAYGMLDPTQASLYIGADPSTNPAYGMVATGYPWYFPWCSSSDYWNLLVGEAPLLRNDGTTDLVMVLTNAPFDIPPHGTAAIHQALYGMPAHNGLADVGLMEQQAMDIAARAARWGGFARGNVNDDGFCDMGDVWWLNYHVNVSPIPLYPDTYSGDVNLDGVVDQADIDQLMAWVSGDASAQPRGQWRFEF